LTKAALLIIFSVCLIGLTFLTQSLHGQDISSSFPAPQEIIHPSVPPDPVQKHVISNSSDIVAIDEAFVSESDGRGNIGLTVTVYFHCMWASNETDVDAGTLYVNTTAYGINETGWVSFAWSSPSVARVAWNTTGVDVGGITAFDQRVPPPTMTWDSITITITVGDDVINVGENALISVSAVFDYDGSPYSGIFTLNDSTLVYYTPGRRAYTVSEATPLDSSVSVISTNDAGHITWDAVYVYETGVWGRSPFFDPEVEFQASEVIQSELDWTLTIYFYLRYMSDDSLVIDQDAIVVVSGRYAFYVSERERWEVNVTSEGIGIVIYQIEYYRDTLGLTIEDPLNLHTTINWFPSGLFASILATGAFGLVLAGGAFLVQRTRKRVAQLERALGPDGVLSVEETELPARTREEIVETLNRLEEVYPLIPTMDKERLVSLEHELRNSMALLKQAIKRDALLAAPGGSLSKLKRALLIRLRLVLETAAKEIASRSR